MFIKSKTTVSDCVEDIKEMLKYQMSLNTLIDPTWLTTNNFDYSLAVLLEAGEAISHHGYKWWKKEEKDLPQLQLEVIDVLHFYLSKEARSCYEVGESLVELKDPLKQIEESWLSQSNVVLFDEKNYYLEELSLIEMLKLISGLASVDRLDWNLFRVLIEEVGLTFEEVRVIYTSKNVLNIFRQKNGYKEGTYEKFWDGKEDNEHLTEIMSGWKQEESISELYERLEVRYRTYFP